MEYYNKYIKYKKKYYNLKYGGSNIDIKPVYIRTAYYYINKQYEKIKEIIKSAKLKPDGIEEGYETKYAILANIERKDAYYLHISYEKNKLKLDIKTNKDKNGINIPIIMTKEYIDFFDIFKIDKDIEKDYIKFSDIFEEKMKEIKYNNLNTITYLPIIFKFTDSEKYINSKTFKHTILYDQFLKYKQLKIEEIYSYYKNNIQYLESKEETDIINDIFNMTDGRQYIYSKNFEEENKKKDIKYFFSLLVTNNEISKELLNSIIYLDDGINYNNNYKQYSINYNAPDNLEKNFNKVFLERGEYLKKIKNENYKLNDETKEILKNIGFTDVDKIEKLINEKLYSLIDNYKYKDNISSLFNIEYAQCNGNVPLSDLELEVDEKLILFDKINKLESEQYKSVNYRFTELLKNSKHMYNDINGIKIYFKLFGKEYNETLEKLRDIEDKDLRTLILKKKELLQKLFNYNVIFFGSLKLLRFIRGNIIIRVLYYLLHSIVGSNTIPLLRWDLLINKYIFACKLNNIKRFFFIFKKEQKLSVKPENRVFEYTKQKYIFLNKISYNNKYLWVFLDKKTQNLILVDRTSSIVYLNNSSIPTNVLYTELKMLLWRKDFTKEDFRFFHIIDDDKKHDTVFCINTKTLKDEYIYENADIKSNPILVKSGMNKSESKHKIIINKDNFIINGIKVREVKLSMDTDGRTIGFFNLQSK